jgi:hypothetical protein
VHLEKVLDSIVSSLNTTYLKQGSVRMLEEQADEIEALEAIYPEEFEQVDGATPPQYRIHLVPDPSEDEENHISLYIICDIPADYPSIKPLLTIEPKKGLSKKRCDEVLEIARAAATENLGMPCVFTIAEAVREWMVDNNNSGQDGSMYAEMMQRVNEKGNEQKKAEVRKATAVAADAEGVEEEVTHEELERIRKRQAGEAVTVDSFLTWKVKFEAEMLEIKYKHEPKKMVREGEEDKPTGRALFMTNRAGMEDALLAAGEKEEAATLAATKLADSLKEGKDGQVAVVSSLYEDDDLDDLDIDQLGFNSEEDDDDDYDDDEKDVSD